MFRPKLLTILSSGYTLNDLRHDLVAGLTVSIIALPLAMALGVASGATPYQGLITAIIAGFLISFFGGSRVQIGGPTGAFVVIILDVIRQFGYDGLLTATLLAGLMLIVAGYLRLGQVIKFIPHPVITGFTGGIALLLISTQIKPLFGLTAGSSIEPITLFVGLFTLATILTLRKINSRIPSYLIALILSSLLVSVLGIPVETIGSRFQEISSNLPLPHLPNLSLERIQELLPFSFTIAFLAGIEALLSAHVADGMSGFRHKPNQELVGQGVANVISALFGGLPATGAIARTATNVSAGARSPFAGLFHSIFLLLFVLFASPLMLYIPMSALASILCLVAWRMSEPHLLFETLKTAGHDRLLLLLTLLLTLFVDLSVAIAVGVTLASLLFVLDMRKSVKISIDESYQRERLPGSVEVFQITGPLFFGMANDLFDLFCSVEPKPRVLILRMGYVPLVDGSGAAALDALVKQCQRHGTQVIFSDMKSEHEMSLSTFGAKKKWSNATFTHDYEAAIRQAEAKVGALPRLAN